MYSVCNLNVQGHTIVYGTILLKSGDMHVLVYLFMVMYKLI